MDQDNRPTLIFVLGLLSLLTCQFLAPVAWIMGNGYLRDCAAMGVEPQGLAVAGRVLGMVGTGLLALSVLIGGMVGALYCLGIGAAIAFGN